ncbi:MAG: hypothetical protein JSU00_15460 [Acidobacteria bacterium]|nr:hypothetical protein [Acidobacteriota bacterium]
MSYSSSRILFWAPRILSIAFIGFLSLFALDVFGEGQGFLDTTARLIMHLIPSMVLVAALVLAWKWEWVGAAFYAAGGVLYVLMVWHGPMPAGVKATWIATISGPAFLIAALFLANWIGKRHPTHS